MSRSAAARLVAVPLLLLAAAGCGDPDPAQRPGSSESSGSTSPSSPADSPTASATPSGPALEVLGAAVTLPEGWQVGRGGNDIGQEATGPGGVSRISLNDLGPSADVGLRRLATEVLAPSSGVDDPTVTVGGPRAGDAPTVLVSGRGTVGDRVVTVGTIRDGYAVSVNFYLDPDEFSQAEADALVDGVLGSFTWGEQP